MKQVMKGMASPTRADAARLKRLARYLLAVPDILWEYPYQELPKEVVVFADADWQGEEDTRRSTSAAVEMLGWHAVDACS
eukprot:1395811-Lingulodinium_polyedra.AAC.1